MAISAEIPLRTIDSEIDPRVELSNEHLVNPTIEPSADNQEQTAEKAHYGRRFWSIFTGLSLTALLSALDGSIVSTAVPTIVGDLNAGENYIWVINIYFLTSATFQPLYGQLADLWGRRWVMISTVAVFTLGSGICGGSSSANMLIGGRAIQGVGAGGINMLVDLIICDLVPLRDRASFVGLLFAIIATSSAVGPLIGGALAQKASWRWIFYMNLPIGGFAMAILFFCLHLSHRKDSTFKSKIRQIDWIGNGALIASTFAILYALTYGGTRYTWSSPRIIISLSLGLVGLALFYFFEMSPFCSYPVVPPRLFGNRTSSAAFFLTFQHTILSMWTVYFLPVYFQSVLGSSPTRSGVQLLPLVLVFPPFAALAGGAVQKTGRYRPIHQLGFALLTLGIGLCSLLDSDSNIGTWVGFQIIIAAGLGMIVAVLLPAVQAALMEKDTASSTATWAFIRSLGNIWGVSIPAAIFNNRFNELLSRISDPSVRALLADGKAYQHASQQFVDSFGGVVRRQIIDTYSDSLKRVWLIGIIMAGVPFLATFAEQEINLRTELHTEFGLEKKEKN
ncbi:hypothetical protein MMC22_001140 [Lobaria immixta]|nr:hypothetical protein [Lobaria immixta]